MNPIRITKPRKNSKKRINTKLFTKTTHKDITSLVRQINKRLDKNMKYMNENYEIF